MEERSPIINTNIRVETVSSKQASTGNMKWIITDMQGLKYFFWQKNRGEDSDVYLSFTGMGVKKGDTIAIGYTEKEESFVNREGKTINYKDRFILGLREASGVPTVNSSPQAQSPRTEANTASQTPSRNWDREAYEKCCSIWSAAMLQKLTQSSEVIGYVERGAFYELFQAIRQSGYDHFENKATATPVKLSTESGRAAFERGMARSKVSPDIAELATQVESEDINVEDIPF